MPSNPSPLTSFKLTEKTRRMSGENKYVFTVRADSTKSEVAKAVKAAFKVTPKAVNMTRGGGGKKAIVTLKPGDTIIESAPKAEEKTESRTKAHDHDHNHAHGEAHDHA